MCNKVARSRLRPGVMIDGEQLEELAESKYSGRLVASVEVWCLEQDE